MSKTIVSGMAPGKGGVPQLLEFLKDTHDLEYPNPSKFKLKRIWNKVVFTLKILVPNQGTLIIMHHHSIPLIPLLKIIYFDDYEYFAIDNSFFCLKSYNHQGEISHTRPCLECLTAANPTKNCKSYPSGRLNIIETFKSLECI